MHGLKQSFKHEFSLMCTSTFQNIVALKRGRQNTGG